MVTLRYVKDYPPNKLLTKQQVDQQFAIALLFLVVNEEQKIHQD